MHHLKSFLFVLLLASVSPLKVFLFGGVFRDINDNYPAYHRLALETGKPTRKDCNQDWDTTDCPKVAVISSGSPSRQQAEQEYSKGDGDAMSTQQFFKGLGMAPKHISIQAQNYETSTNLWTYEGYRNYFFLLVADIIYFNGGDQSLHARVWLNNDNTPNPMFSIIQSKAINNQAVLVGTAAGSDVMASTIYGGGSPFGHLYFANSVGLAPNTLKEGKGLQDTRNGTGCLQSAQNGAKLSGFGFVNFAVDTHFDARGRLGRIIPGLAQLNAKVGVGIDEGGCIYYKDGIGTVYGKENVFIVDPSQSIKVKSSFFHIKNVKLHFLSNGDTFNFKTLHLTTIKKAIAPSISGFSDSYNILSGYECTRLITRLLDQTGMENLGKTQIPKDAPYPQETPVFDILFYKGSETKGYKSIDGYTGENIWVDVSGETRN